jgi:hypothetical protein
MGGNTQLHGPGVASRLLHQVKQCVVSRVSDGDLQVCACVCGGGVCRRGGG